MEILNYTLKGSQQANGLYGMPYMCYYYDKFFPFDSGTHIKHSALVLAIAEVYKAPFKVTMIDNDGFLCQIKEGKSIYVDHNAYSFNDGVLTFDKTKEGIISKLVN